MIKDNRVFIATSIDGYIADRNGGIDWLHSLPNPTQDDMGYQAFINDIDAIVMGRTTFETVCGFDMAWPYNVPVFVLSNSLKQLDGTYRNKAFLLKGNPTSIVSTIHEKGYYRLYIDGATTIQQFLAEDLIDEMIITTIPILLGGGIPLFGELKSPLRFRCQSTTTYIDQVAQKHFVRNRD